jgi:hypothetical protein
MSTRNRPGGKKHRAWQPCRHLWAEYLEMWESQHLATLEDSTACYRNSLTYFTYHIFASQFCIMNCIPSCHLRLGLISGIFPSGFPANLANVIGGRGSPGSNLVISPYSYLSSFCQPRCLQVRNLRCCRGIAVRYSSVPQPSFHVWHTKLKLWFLLEHR